MRGMTASVPKAEPGWCLGDTGHRRRNRTRSGSSMVNIQLTLSVNETHRVELLPLAALGVLLRVSGRGRKDRVEFGHAYGGASRRSMPAYAI